MSRGSVMYVLVRNPHGTVSVKIEGTVVVSLTDALSVRAWKFFDKSLARDRVSVGVVWDGLCLPTLLALGRGTLPYLV